VSALPLQGASVSESCTRHPDDCVRAAPCPFLGQGPLAAQAGLLLGAGYKYRFDDFSGEDTLLGGVDFREWKGGDEPVEGELSGLP
jgi:hypothetical protein